MYFNIQAIGVLAPDVGPAVIKEALILGGVGIFDPDVTFVTIECVTSVSCGDLDWKIGPP